MPPRRVFAFAALLLLTACADQRTARSGFLADPAMTADPAAPQALAFTAPTQRFAGYRAVWVEEVALAPDAVGAAVPDSLRASYRLALRDAFAERNFRVLDEAPTHPAEALRVRAAITVHEHANPGLSAGAASEAEVLDAATGERLAARASQDNGALGGPPNPLREYRHARAALTRQARELAAQVPRRPQNWADAR